MNHVRRTQRSFRPRFEGAPLEERQVLSAAPAGLAIAPAFLIAPAPLPATPFQVVGNMNKGNRPLGNSGEKVEIFAVEVHGSFNAATASNAWSYGIANAANKGLTLATTDSVGNRRTTSDYYELLGRWNPTARRGGWVAATYGGSYGTVDKSGPWWNPTYTTSMHYQVESITNYNSTPTYSDGSFTGRWNGASTRGYTIALTMATDSSHDIRPTFQRPY